MSKIWEPEPKEVYRKWINDILDEASDKLNDWESNFIDNISNRLMIGNLTQAQAEKLEQIYVKHTS